MELTIGEKQFSMRRPVRKQIAMVFALAKEYNLVHLFTGQSKNTEAENIERGIDIMATDFESRLATIAFVENGKEFKDSFESNKDLIYDYLENLDAATYGICEVMNSFFGLMPQATVPNKNQKKGK